MLETVKSYYAREKNTIHVNAYERAIYQIRKWPHPITKGKDIAHLEGIGKGMVQKIDTILATGTLPIIQEKNLKITSKLLDKGTKKSGSQLHPISQVLGFSEKSAAELEKQYGIKSVEELLKLASDMKHKLKLTRIQQMGLRYHNDLKEKVPRAAVSQIGAKIEKCLKSINGDEVGDEVMIFLAGSYPSGLKKESKDIDILLVVRNSSKLKFMEKSYLKEIVAKLHEKIPLETITIGANKFLGLVKLEDQETAKWRHLDMRLVDITSFPYAWLYYSSGVVFNKLIREKLKKRGYKLNEWGLYKDGMRVPLDGEESKAELEKQMHNQDLLNQDLLNQDLLNQEFLEYAKKIEKEIFKLADLEYKTIQERY